MPLCSSSVSRPASQLFATIVLATFCATCFAQGIRGFGPSEGKGPLPGFGDPHKAEMALRRQFPKLAAAVTAGDRTNALREIERTDLNGDKIVTQAEWAESGYQVPDRFLYNDLNGDGTLTAFEHSLRWAQYRTGKEKAAAQQQKDARQGPGAAAQKAPPAPRGSAVDPRQQQTSDLAAFVVSLYDRNANGAVDRSEFQSPLSPFGNVAAADTDANGAVVQAELAAWLTVRRAKQPEFKPPDDFPRWFLQSDLDQDGQVHVAEFVRFSPRTPIAEFQRFDRNDDGFVTAKEFSTPAADDTQRFASGLAHIVEAGAEVYADIFVTEDFVIEDIDVQLAFIKKGDDDIELALLAPDGTQAALYFDAQKKPWGGGRLFDNTLIDDEAPALAQRLPQPPLHQAFRSQGSTTQGMKGLKAHYGKRTRGTWRLSIRNKSRIDGMLEGWALLIKSRKQAPPDSRAARSGLGDH
jgi:Ca2+-binding EF-hand superfamily protein/subtilisin-like proprotein convertase family protein